MADSRRRITACRVGTMAAPLIISFYRQLARAHATRRAYRRGLTALGSAPLQQVGGMRHRRLG